MIRTLADGLLAVILAPVCAACREPLERPTLSIVCAPCWASIVPLTPPFCAACGEPVPLSRTTEPGDRCAHCRRLRSVIAAGRSVSEYAGTMRSVLHALKYDGRRSIAPALSRLMRECGESVLNGADWAVPVPLHWRRRWARGFNQATELASGLGLPVVQALRRNRHTRSQTDFPAARRHANVRHAFAPARRTPPAGRCIVLVDDVSTTGATLEACARTLLRAGAREVRTLTAARAVSRLRSGRPR